MDTNQNYQDDWKSDYDRALKLYDLLEIHATGGRSDERTYGYLRDYFCREARFRSRLPDWLFSCRTLSQFWPYIKSKFASYAERRDFSRVEFAPLLEFLEIGQRVPLDEIVTQGLLGFKSGIIQARWQSALERRDYDPEGAITSARTLLETVCKHILDECGVEYDDGKIELTQLYKLTAKELNLAPEQHQEEIFRQILGGCSSVVHGLGSLRNRLGDAHGTGKNAVKPAPRHATLAVNLSGTIALFLVETYNHRSAIDHVDSETYPSE